ncbi:rhomboid family intramembrane serine protease [Massilia sp. SYSU DXS3249]
MPGSTLFDVRFYTAGRNWPSNPYRFRGKGTLAFEPDFVFVRGCEQRSFRLPKREEHRIRMADIVNAWSNGQDVWFDVLGVKGDVTVGFSVADADTAKRIVALLPARQTEAFVREHEENEVFHDRIDYWSPSTPVIWGLLAANIGIFALMWYARQHYQASLAGPLREFFALHPNVSAMLHAQQLVDWGSNLGRRTLGGEWWRLVSSMFLHGSIWHLGFNMLALWQVGRLTERIFGSARFIGLYLLAGVSGSIASVLWNPNVNSVGASGAIFGIIGGLLAFLGRPNSGVPPTVVSELRASLVPFLLFSLWMGFIYPHTDNAAHIGGLLGGWLAGHLLARSIHVPGQKPA